MIACNVRSIYICTLCLVLNFIVSAQFTHNIILFFFFFYLPTISQQFYYSPVGTYVFQRKKLKTRPKSLPMSDFNDCDIHAGISTWPASMDRLSPAMLSPTKGIVAVVMKNNSTPNDHTSTGRPT